MAVQRLIKLLPIPGLIIVMGAAGVLASGDVETPLLTLNMPNPQADARFGYSVAVGDVDGDGKADIVVGAPRENVGDNMWQGRAYVFSGATGSLLLALDTPNAAEWTFFGHAVAVGDVDGDGKGDIAVGAPWENVGGNPAQGRAYVFSGADGSPLLTLDSPNPQANGDFGSSVSVGDVDGDGKGDIAVGAFYEKVGDNEYQGRTYVFFGPTGSPVSTLNLPVGQEGARFGWSVAVGDVDADGKADIAVGAPKEDVGGATDQGRAYVFSGPSGSPVSTLDIPIPQEAAEFGSSVAVGDVNGDHNADIAVGAPKEDVGGATDAGRAYVFRGPSGSPVSPLNIPIPQEGAEFGSSVAVGDVSGDGNGDIAVGAPSEDVNGNADQGRAYVFLGPTGSPVLTLDTPNPQAGARFGMSVAVGDVDADSNGDIAVGAPREDAYGNADQGRAYVFSGPTGSLLFTLDSPMSTPNPQALVSFGSSVALGDVDGDGKADIVVGAPGEDVGSNANQGRAYVFSGDDGSLLFLVDSPNPQEGAEFGSSVAVGDVDGDGNRDIAVGAPREDVGDKVHQGRAYVFSGDDGSLLIPALDTPDPQGDAHFGLALAVADVDDDGKGDIVVGAYGQNVGGNVHQGRAYVFFGPTGSVVLTLDTPNPQGGARFGKSVAVGDVDADGKADIAVGAYSEDVGDNADQGRAYIFFGPTGSPVVTLDIPDPQAYAKFGHSVAVGDVDGDDKGDIAVSVYGWSVDMPGRAYVFSGQDSSLLLILTTPNPQSDVSFAYWVVVGDVSGDGKADVALLAFGEEVDGNRWQGRVYVFSGAGGSLLFTLDTPNPQGDAYFGYAAAVGDVDGDGKGDIAVGAPHEYVGAASDQGRAYVFSLADLDGNGAVGGVAELPELDQMPLQESHEHNVSFPVGIVAALALGAIPLAGAAWYAKRRGVK